MSFAKLDDLGRKLEALEHALSILGADEATHMAVGGGEKRAEAMSQLAGMYHAQAIAPEIGDWIASAKAEALTEDQILAIGEFERNYINATCLPTEFVQRRTAATLRSEQLWRELRPRGDWDSFLPALEGVVSLVREEAALRAAATGLSPYDALMDQYDPGNRTADIDAVFADLKSFLKEFVPTALVAQQERLARRPRKALNAHYPIEKQRELGLAAMRAVGFDFTHGSLAVSHHPFCGGVPSDVRMTTRYRTDEFLTSLMGVLHETGHALYEQGLPKGWSHWPLGKARGMGMHESQSLFVEMQIARSGDFWTYMLPLVHQHLGEDAILGWDVADILSEVNFVERGYIRVDADEVTYPLHVILRYELEQDLVSGKLEASQIPEAWDAKMIEYLGISTIDDPKDGPMQDVHWPGGAFGYFPSYTLGAMIAAQLGSAMKRDIPDMGEHMQRGDFTAINRWRADKVWSQASRYSTPDLIMKATGEALNAEHFKVHLTKRYG
ncbi:carboxypeptidase M32 [Devosia faecipullorum]|uniref:carboxypeptidase M32 n=1 Tax=Devosia faecipullorum TaxID=2755039 RepID=UPI00187B9B80|nr:carboxypeptidase M32 [Devosia faecipullorum]MBE7732095.1 carboxypeptidase M32 [Devosia faecipullorum]